FDRLKAGEFAGVDEVFGQSVGVLPLFGLKLAQCFAELFAVQDATPEGCADKRVHRRRLKTRGHPWLLHMSHTIQRWTTTNQHYSCASQAGLQETSLQKTGTNPFRSRFTTVNQRSYEPPAWRL